MTCPLNSSLFLSWLRLIWMVGEALDVGGGDSDRAPPIKSRCLIRVNNGPDGPETPLPVYLRERPSQAHGPRTMRSLLSSRLPPSCSGLACGQVSPTPNWLPVWAPASRQLLALRVAKHFQAPRHSCATPMRPVPCTAIGGLKRRGRPPDSNFAQNRRVARRGR